MASVTQRIKQVKQPYGGYISPKRFQVSTYHDGEILADHENVHPTLVGTAVDYLTRYMLGSSAESAFEISMRGASLFEELMNCAARNDAKKLLNGIHGLDSTSITNACKLVGYDVWYRSMGMGYKPVEEIIPDFGTIHNIDIMVRRGLSLFADCKKDQILTGFSFSGGYTDLVDIGDGDYMTPDTIWDFKVSRSEPDSKQTLQLLMYHILGVHSIHPEFEDITKLGIFNPRKNKSYILELADIPPEIINAVSRDVIGY